MSSASGLFPVSSMRAAHIRNLKIWQKDPGFKKDSVVLITGAGSGIARQVARIYASRGARLVLCDFNKAALIDSVQECRRIAHTIHNIPVLSSSAAPVAVNSVLDAKPQDVDSVLLNHDSILGIVTDVTVEKQCHAFIDLAVTRFGVIDTLILCAGIGAHNTFANTQNMDIFHRCINVNYYGYLYCTHAAFPHLMRSKGTLTAITSFSGEVGLPFRTAYCASKFAVTGFLEALRAEIADKPNKFDIVLVCPPSTNTNLRKNSLTTDEALKTAGADEGKSMSVEDCASCVVDATDRKLRKAFFPWSSTIASYLRPLVPDLIDDKIWAKSRL